MGAADPNNFYSFSPIGSTMNIPPNNDPAMVPKSARGEFHNLNIFQQLQPNPN